jgi:hypothetical protein
MAPFSARGTITTCSGISPLQIMGVSHINMSSSHRITSTRITFTRYNRGHCYRQTSKTEGKSKWREVEKQSYEYDYLIMINSTITTVFWMYIMYIVDVNVFST